MSIVFLALCPMIHGRKIPGIIKKINKALGLFVKSEQLWDIFPDIEKLQSANDTLSAQIAANKAGVETNVEMLENTDEVVNQLAGRIEDLENLHTTTTTTTPTTTTATTTTTTDLCYQEEITP